jgi:3-oxoacyl-[acyl-carrier-protein] synthase II
VTRTWSPEDLVVTGTGCVTPFGVGVDALLRGWRDGACALRPVTRFATDALPVACGGEMPAPRVAHDGGGRGAAHLDEALEEALRGSRLADVSRPLVLVSTTKGFLESGASVAAGAEEADPGLPARMLAVRFPGATVATISTACAGGTAALVLALAHAASLRSGEHDAIVVAGIDLLSDFVFAGFAALAAVDPLPCRPFDRSRAGLSPAEAAGVIVVETLGRVRARGAAPLGRLLGGGLASDAGHPTAPDPEGAGLASAMEAALRRAEIDPDAVGHVNAHGTGTVRNDAMEVRALERVFGARAPRLPVTTLKAGIGHSFGAAGVVEFVASLAALRAGVLPGIAGLRDPVPGVGVAPGPRDPDGPVFLKAGAGFGGFNAALVAEGVLP